MKRIAGLAARVRAAVSLLSSRRRRAQARTSAQFIEAVEPRTHLDASWASGNHTWTPNTHEFVVPAGAAATIHANPGTDAPRITVNAGATLTINPTSGLAVHVASLTLSGGAVVTLAAHGGGGGTAGQRVLVVDGIVAGGGGTPGLTIDAASTLDITDNAVIVRYAPA